ncbi:hypothetical protein RDABS01_011626 [Bienertia sinuspersici]
MEKLNEEQRRPWLCGGDFNLMLMSSKKKGGNGFKVNEAETFRDAIESCHMMDLGFNGHEFTWTNNRAGDHNVQERLDRFLANQLWKDLFLGSFVTHLSRRRSDHLPIMLCLKGYPRAKNERKKKKLFKFEEIWLKENMCEEIIKEAWQLRGSFCSKLEATSTQLIRWSKETFGSFAREMRDCKKMMEKLMEMEPTEEDGWIPTMPRFRPLPRGVMEEVMPTYVSELIEQGRWKEEVLRNIFSMWEIEEITKIPLPAFAKSDE